MSNKQRIQRPLLDRTQPIRSWSTLFRAPTDSAGGDGSGAADGDQPSASLGDAISRSVELGYQVIDGYIRQGQQAAERLSKGSYGPEVAVRDAQELVARMAQQASELLDVWLRLADLGVAGAAARSGATPGSSPEIAPQPASKGAGEQRRPAPVRVRIEVASRQPTEVTLDLAPYPPSRVIIHSLRSPDPAKPRLSEVSLQPSTRDDDAAVLRIRVPDDQPPGVYNGLIIDEATSRPVGTLSVRVDAA